MPGGGASLKKRKAAKEVKGKAKAKAKASTAAEKPLIFAGRYRPVNSPWVWRWDNIAEAFKELPSSIIGCDTG